MKITFHGAARTVTGSKHLITLKNNVKILLDCGMFQGEGRETDTLNREFGFDPAEVNYLILSHAHIDHCGLIPKLVKDGFNGPIFCTSATRDLAEILLKDSAYIQEYDVRFSHKRNVEGDLPYLEPLYTEEDAQEAMRLFKIVEYGQHHRITDDVSFIFTDAGHIIGAASVHVKIQENGKETNISFSGDVGRYGDVILKSPQEFPQADFILIESTYGNSLHEPVTTTPQSLLSFVESTCVQKKGKLIIPAFSVGRTQEILFDLNKLFLEKTLPSVDIFVDSPLSTEATEVVKSHPECFNKSVAKLLETDDPFDFPRLHYIKDVEESKMLNFRKEPCVIISASGMAEAGRVKHHIANNISHEKNTILIVGYCEPESLGGRLMRGANEVSIYGERMEVKADIGVLHSMSAHGDYNDLSQFLACQNPRDVKQLFLVHGEYPVQVDFRDHLIKKGFADVQIPARHETVGLG
jgi:metallo-beta-lactamase family protein